MKLYTLPGACSMADHIALQWSGAPFEAQILTKEELKQPWFLELNASGSVPVLEDQGWILTQNAAILNYLADRFPEAKLGGDGSPKGRAEVNRWLSLINADVHPTFRPLFGSFAFLGNDGEEKTKANAREKLRSYFERLDAQLANQDYLVGQRSIADPYLFVVFRWAKKFKIDLSGLTNLDAFNQRMTADPGVQAAMQAEGQA